MLSQRELLDCAEVLRTSRSLLEYIRGDRKFDTSIDEIFERLIPDKKSSESDDIRLKKERKREESKKGIGCSSFRPSIPTP